jgi:plastocyanin
MRTRVITVLVLGIVALLVLAACGGDDDSASGSASGSGNKPQLSGTVNDKGTKTVSGSQLDIEADDFYFKPTFVDAKPGTKLTIQIENEGKNEHTFTIDSANVDQDIAPGKKAEVSVTVPASGNLNFYCRFHRGSGMQGAIVATG